MERVIAIVLKLTGAPEVAAGLKSVGTQVGTMADTFKSKLTSLTENARWASVFIGKALMDMVGNIGELISNFQSFSVMAEFMTGSAEGADRMAQSIRRMATETIFGIDQITELSKRMIGNTKDVERSEKAMMSLMDAVAATGGGYSELEGATRAWIQTNAKAKASSEELNRQFSNANIPVLRSLAESVVNDLNHPLRKYLEVAGGSGGATSVTKTMTKAFQSANEKLPILEKSLKKAEEGLKAYNDSGKKTAESTLAHELAVDRARLALDKAKGSITAYDNAQKSTNKTMVAAKLTVDDVMAQLQKVGDLDIPGSVMADAITRALNEAYGGANQKLVNTFMGQLEKLKDMAKMAALSFLGLDENFRPIGGVVNILTGLLTKLNDMLQNNQESIQKLGMSLSNSIPFLLAVAGIFAGVFYGAVTGILAPIATAAAIFATIGGLLGLLITSFVDLTPMMDMFTKSAGDQKDTLEEMQKTMSVLPDEVERLKKQEEIAKEQTDKFETSVGILKESLGYLKDSVEKVARALGLLKGSGDQAKLGFDKLLLLASGSTLLFQQANIYLVRFIYQTRIAIETLLAFYDLLTLNLDKTAEHLVKTMDLQRESDLAVSNLKTNIVNQLTAINDAWNNTGSTVSEFSDLYNSKINSCMIETQTALTGMQSTMDYGFSQMKSTVQLDMADMSTNVTNSSATIKKDMTKSVEAVSYSVMNNESGFPAMSSQMNTDMQSMVKSAETEMPKVEKAMTDPLSRIGKWLDDVAQKISNWINRFKEAQSISGEKGGFGQGAFYGQHGGIVPGSYNTPVPAILHAGERVVPRTGTDVGGMGGQSFSINFYGGVQMDSSERINELAKEIGRILGRQNELARYGAGF